MKVYRYMSIDEFYNVTAGIPLESYGKFLNCRTNSEGFCFFTRADTVLFWDIRRNSNI